MDADSKIAIELLDVLGDCNAKLSNLAQLLRDHHEVIGVLQTLECRKYATGSLIEGYVDAELRNGKAVCWYLEVRWNSDNWTFDTRILINDSEGQETVHKFLNRDTGKFTELLNNLVISTEELTKFDGLKLVGIES